MVKCRHFNGAIRKLRSYLARHPIDLTLAHEFSFTDAQMLYIRWGALLHDIGKMGIPDNILLNSVSRLPQRQMTNTLRSMV